MGNAVRRQDRPKVKKIKTNQKKVPHLLHHTPELTGKEKDRRNTAQVTTQNIQP